MATVTTMTIHHDDAAEQQRPALWMYATLAAIIALAVVIWLQAPGAPRSIEQVTEHFTEQPLVNGPPTHDQIRAKADEVVTNVCQNGDGAQAYLDAVLRIIDYSNTGRGQIERSTYAAFISYACPGVNVTL